MDSQSILQKHFNGEDGSFLLAVRSFDWDWDAFREMVSAMYDVAAEVKGRDSIETWIAEGFWFCDTWIRSTTGHPSFVRPEREAYDAALELIGDLAYFLFIGESPYTDDTLVRSAKGRPLH